MTAAGQRRRSNGQLIWGIALVLVGIGVFIRIPQALPKLAETGSFAGALGFIQFCLYLMGVILLGGGIKKIIAYFRLPDSVPEKKSGEDHQG